MAPRPERLMPKRRGKRVLKLLVGANLAANGADVFAWDVARPAASGLFPVQVIDRTVFLAPRTPARRFSTRGELSDEGASQHRPLAKEGADDLPERRMPQQSYMQSSI
jgi:hypothetical protein